MKYAAANAVRVTSSVRMAEFVSTARKYPCSRMFEKTRICRKIAPPRQLKPMLWMSKPMRWWNRASMVIFLPEGTVALLILNIYEKGNRISNNYPETKMLRTNCPANPTFDKLGKHLGIQV